MTPKDRRSRAANTSLRRSWPWAAAGLLATTLVVGACGGDDDVATFDARPATPDAPLHDAALPDAATQDAALPDAPRPDATPPDAATPDALVKTQMTLPITFDSPSQDYGLVGFGGADDSTIVADPTNASNQVAKVVKSATAESWAGTTITAPAQLGLASKVPFDAANTRMTVRVWSPDAGIKVRLKVEDHADAAVSVETEATTTQAGAWETLTFEFASVATGTAALNFSKSYDKIGIFFNFGVTGAQAGAKTYYFDDVTFIGGTTPVVTFAKVDFDSITVTYSMSGFGCADDSSVVVDPTNASNMVGKVVKSATAETWAGTTVATGPNNSVGKIPFATGKTQLTVRVWSPHAPIPVRLKAENASDPTKSVETEATVTTASAWETLTFDFANQAAGTAALNLDTTYDKLTIFFNFGVGGAAAGERTYYLDDITFVP